MAGAKTKKLINAPGDVIAELIDGMVGAHPDILRLGPGSGRALVAIDGPRDGKVGIVVGGGSGHEPLFSGYVGRGLADAAAVGNVFASPSPDQCADAARAADGGAGVLFLYGNYTGDVMNFDMAAEILAAEGVTVRSLQVTDDVASAPADRKDQRRGIAGNVFVYKAAGAAADLGGDLDEVERVARRANARTASMGVALGPCSLPQTAVPNFHIGDDEMEIGMGIHGEPGIARVPLERADAVADRFLDAILGDLDLARGDRVAVLVNGLGSTTLLELYILHRRVRVVLDRRGIAIHRSLVGEYATSLEMAGASVTLMHLDDDLIRLLDHPCRSVALTIGDAPAPVASAPRARTAAPAMPRPEVPVGPLKTDGTLTPAQFRDMMLGIAMAIDADAGHLSQLDGVIGDGDHGVTMQTGWQAIRSALDRLDSNATISAQCRAMSQAFLNAVGASAGPLYATAFLRAADAVADRLNLDGPAIAAWIAAMCAGIESRGGAAPGDKTMIDAWHPAAAAALASDGSVAACLAAACTAAETGMAATAGMTARRGRSAKLGDRSLGHVDAGAASAVTILKAMARAARS